MKTISREQRARQFMPFASLRGYYAYVREQERHREPRRELSDDQAEEPVRGALRAFPGGYGEDNALFRGSL